MAPEPLPALLAAVRACRVCASCLPRGPGPIVQIGAGARLLVISQAPGLRAHRTRVPFDDPTGDRLRDWLGMERSAFYDPERLAILPMGFCYPGRGRQGDLPPRPECAPLWHARLLEIMPRVRLTLLIGRHAQERYLDHRGYSLTERVRAFRRYLPAVFPLPHPSPRNRPWLFANPWFEADVLPALREEVSRALAAVPSLTGRFEPPPSPR